MSEKESEYESWKDYFSRQEESKFDWAENFKVATKSDTHPLSTRYLLKVICDLKIRIDKLEDIER